MKRQTGFSETLPDVLALLGKRVAAEADGDDETAQELMKCLDLSWAFAERWRIEGHPELLHLHSAYVLQRALTDAFPCASPKRE